MQLNIRQVHKDRALWVSCAWWQYYSPGNPGMACPPPGRGTGAEQHCSATSSRLSHTLTVDMTREPVTYSV